MYKTFLRDADYKTSLRDAEYETEIASLSCTMYTHATADKFGGQCVNSCSARSENIWASDMWVKLLSPSLLLLTLSSSFFNAVFLMLSFSNIKSHVTIDVRRWGRVCSELSDSLHRPISLSRDPIFYPSHVPPPPPPSISSSISLIFWFGSVYLSSNLNMKPDQSVYFAPISFAQAYEQETFDIKGIGGSSEILVGNC